MIGFYFIMMHNPIETRVGGRGDVSEAGNVREKIKSSVTRVVTTSFISCKTIFLRSSMLCHLSSI